MACDKGPTPSTLIVDVIGSRMAFESFDVRVEPLMADPALKFRSPYLAKRFTGSFPVTALAGTGLELVSTSNGVDLSRVPWQTFVCALDPRFSERVAQGWRAQETLGAFLQNDGVLTIESDFGRSLPHNCQWSWRGGGDDYGFGTLNRSSTLCTETERASTRLEITDDSESTRPFAIVPTNCEAYHAKPETKDPDFAGLISTQILGKDSQGWSITLTLSHCWSTGEVYPVSVTPASLATDACGVAIVAVQSPDGNTTLRLVADSGTWQLSNGPELAGGGHQVGDVDMTFSDPAGGGRHFVVRGHVDLPIVKIDVIRLR